MWIPTHCNTRPLAAAGRQQNHSRAVVMTVAAAAVFVALMSMPTVAHAQNVTRTKQVTQDRPFTDHSICTEEDIEGSAHVVFTQETTTSSNRPTRFRTTDHENGKGTGVDSGAQYQLQDVTQQETITTTANNFTDTREERKHLIRTTAGTLPANLKDDDEFIRQFIRTTVTNGEPGVTVENTRIECK